MCRYCGKYICPPSCPNYCGRSAERGRKIAECTICKCSICEFDELIFSYGKPYCKTCYQSIRRL